MSTSFLGGLLNEIPGELGSKESRIACTFPRTPETPQTALGAQASASPDSTDYIRKAGTLEKHCPEVETQRRSRSQRPVGVGQPLPLGEEGLAKGIVIYASLRAGVPLLCAHLH